MTSTEYDDIRARWLSKRQRAAAAAGSATSTVSASVDNFLSTSKLSINLNHNNSNSTSEVRPGDYDNNWSQSSSPLTSQLQEVDDKSNASVLSARQHELDNNSPPTINTTSNGTRPRRVFRLRHRAIAGGGDEDDEANNNDEIIESCALNIKQQQISTNSSATPPPTSTVLHNTPPSTQSADSTNSCSSCDDDNENGNKMNINCQHRQQLHATAVKSRRGTYSIVFTPAVPLPLLQHEELLSQHNKNGGTSCSATVENSSSATSRDDNTAEVSDNDEGDDPPVAVRMRYKNGFSNNNNNNHHRHSTANIYLEHLNELNNKPRLGDRLRHHNPSSGGGNPYTMHRHLTCSTFKNVLAKFQTVDQQRQQPQQQQELSRNSSRSSAIATNNGHRRQTQNFNYNRYPQHYSSTLSIPTSVSETNKLKNQQKPINPMGNAAPSSYTTTPSTPPTQQNSHTHGLATDYDRMQSSNNAEDSLYGNKLPTMSAHVQINKTPSSQSSSRDHQHLQQDKLSKPETTMTTNGVQRRMKPPPTANQPAPPPHWRHSTSTLSLAIKKFEKLNSASMVENGNEQLSSVKTRPTVTNALTAPNGSENDGNDLFRVIQRETTVNGHHHQAENNDRQQQQQRQVELEPNGSSSKYYNFNDMDNNRRRSSIPAGVVLEKMSRFEALSEQQTQEEQTTENNNAIATTSDTQTPTPPPPPTRRRSSVNLPNASLQANVQQDQQIDGNAEPARVRDRDTLADPQQRIKKTAPIKSATNLVKDRLKQFESTASNNSKFPHEQSLYQQTLKNDWISKSTANLSPHHRTNNGQQSSQQQRLRPAASIQYMQNVGKSNGVHTSAAADLTTEKQTLSITHSNGSSAPKDARLRSSTTPTDSRLSAPLSRPTSSSFGDDEDGEGGGATPPPSDEVGDTANGGSGRRIYNNDIKSIESQPSTTTDPNNNASVPPFIVATRRGTFGAPAKFVVAQRKSLQQEVILPKCKSFTPGQLEEMVDLARELVAIAPIEERDRFIYAARIERPSCQNNGGGVGLVLCTENTKVLISKVISHSLAHRQTTVEGGDRLIVVNGTLIDIDMHHREALQILKAPRAEVVLVLQRGKDEPLPPAGQEEQNEQTQVVEPPPSTATIVNDSLRRLNWVHLTAEEDGFGFSVDGGRSPSNIGNSKPIVIRRIYANSPAERSTRMHVGDEIMEIDGQRCSNMTKFHAWDLLKSFQPGQQVGMKIRQQQKTKSSRIDSTTNGSEVDA